MQVAELSHLAERYGATSMFTRTLVATATAL
jgi:hypothetical protein